MSMENDPLFIKAEPLEELDEGPIITELHSDALEEIEGLMLSVSSGSQVKASHSHRPCSMLSVHHDHIYAKPHDKQMVSALESPAEAACRQETQIAQHQAKEDKKHALLFCTVCNDTVYSKNMSRHQRSKYHHYAKAKLKSKPLKRKYLKVIKISSKDIERFFHDEDSKNDFFSYFESHGYHFGSSSNKTKKTIN